MTCPNCGADPKGAFVREFCGSHVVRVATGAAGRRGAANDTGSAFCAACGAEVAAYCPNCGQTGPLGAGYCGN